MGRRAIGIGVFPVLHMDTTLAALKPNLPAAWSFVSPVVDHRASMNSESGEEIAETDTVLGRPAVVIAFLSTERLMSVTIDAQHRPAVGELLCLLYLPR